MGIELPARPSIIQTHGCAGDLAALPASLPWHDKMSLAATAGLPGIRSRHVATDTHVNPAGSWKLPRAVSTVHILSKRQALHT